MLVNRNRENLSTTVYCKATNSNECLNFSSLCPVRYKTAVIRSFVSRAHAVCSSWESFHSEVQRIRNLLVNNNCPIKLIDFEVQRFLNEKFEGHHPRRADLISFFYRNQYSSTAKIDEYNLKRSVARNVQPISPEKSISIQVYYKNVKLRSLFISNKTSRSYANERVVYQYTCAESGCNTTSYIGYTTCSLAKRF